MNRDRPKSTALLRKIASYRASQHPLQPRLFKAIIVTVDCPAPGKREPDEKVKAEVELVSRLHHYTLPLSVTTLSAFALFIYFGDDRKIGTPSDLNWDLPPFGYRIWAW